jgi:hypothetical protein
MTTKSLARKAVEVDCSSWGGDPGPAGGTSGRFVMKSSARPALEVDFSGVAKPLGVSLELTISPDPKADAVQLAFGLLDLLNAVNQHDRALGGTGLSRTAGRQADARLTLTLASDEPAGAEARVRQICDMLNRPLTEAEFRLPDVVQTIAARVA